MMQENTVVSPRSSSNIGSTPMMSFNELPPLPVEQSDGTFHLERDIARPLEDASERTHDQLPAVESQKSNQTTFDNIRRTHRRKVLLLVAVAITFAAICVTLGVVIGRDEVENENALNDLPDIDIPITDTPNVEIPNVDTPDINVGGSSSYPTRAPSTADSRNPNATLTIGRTPSRFENVKAFVSTNGWSTLTSTIDEESPQYQAALWMADFDPLNIELQETNLVRNRYVLAVLYFALNGLLWSHDLNWMKIFDVCAWNDEWQSTLGPVKVGVECTDNSVNRIFLPSMNAKGEIPTEVGLLVDLQVLNIYSNDLIGTIPEAVGKLSFLNDLVLHDNSLTGTLPSWIFTMTNLKTLDLARNSFVGELPSTFNKLSRLTSLNLENNQFNGTIDRLTDFNSVTLLRLGNNSITGALTPDILLSWGLVEELDLSSNKLTGNLPDILFELESLRVLDLHDNDLDGSIPQVTIGAKSTLEFLSLSQNRLSGSIHSSISYLSKLRHLDLSWNLLDGIIPLDIENLFSLKYLFLAFNPKFTAGPIPKEWDSLSELVDLSLQGTNRNGTIPGELGLLRKLVLLDLAGNQLTGEIPDDLGDLSNLSFLFLKDNKLIGSIPTSLGQLSLLNTIVIDHNSLTGGATNLCSPKKASLEVFVSDCQEIGCETSCCTRCCTSKDADDNDPSCNIKWFSPVDPIAGYEYQRVGYKFNEKDIVSPVPGDADMVADYYHTFGIPGSN